MTESSLLVPSDRRRTLSLLLQKLDQRQDRQLFLMPLLALEQELFSQL
jgi:hypothetical protein